MTIVVVEEEEGEDENNVLTGKFSEGISEYLHSSNRQHKSCSTAREKINVHIYMFLNERCEGRKKEASKVKQTNKAKQHSTPKYN